MSEKRELELFHDIFKTRKRGELWLATVEIDRENSGKKFVVRGRPLSKLGLLFGKRRRWYEYLPFIGDAMFRKRIFTTRNEMEKWLSRRFK